MFDPDQLISTLEFGNHALTDEEKEAITQFYNGRALQQMVIMPGWNVLMQAFEDHKQNALDELGEKNPADKELVLAAHAVWYAVRKTLDDIKYEVQAAIESSKQAPEILDRLKN
jgi:ATP-dependent exoDNAse (exonuclease V) alpha subunit